MANHIFELPAAREPASLRAMGQARSLTHKGEWLQGPIPVIRNGVEVYTIGVFSLLDDLHSAFVDVRRRPADSTTLAGTFTPVVRIHPNGWNDGEVEIVEKSVRATWLELGAGERCSYDVYGYHDIKVGAGSGSSSALAQAAIRATALEHVPELDNALLSAIQSRVEPGADPLHMRRPAVVATRIDLGRLARPLGERTPDLCAVTWSAGDPVETSKVQFEYDDETLLLWRVRWTSLERAVRSADDVRVARLATESARENQHRVKKVDIGLLEAAVTDFGALGFSVAHTGTYHTALFPSAVPAKVLNRYREYVSKRSEGDPGQRIESFNTAQAAARRDD